LELAGITRRLIAGAYDLLLLLAVLFVAAFIFLFLFGSAVEPPRRYFFQAYLLLVSGSYFGWFWLHGGQTLAMKTWRLHLVSVDGAPLSLQQCFIRFLLAVAGLAFFGAGWWWALFDREGCLLHDRIAGTRLMFEVI
jgi:uncharacterized RDD family membrane protein YckC